MFGFLAGLFVTKVIHDNQSGMRREDFEGPDPKYRDHMDYLNKTGDVRGAQDLVMLGPQSGWYNKG